MLESMFYAIGTIAILFMILAILWRSLTFSIIDLILWLVMAISVYNLERPYQYAQAGKIYTAIHVMENSYYLAPLFILMAIIMTIYTWHLAFDLLKGRRPRIM